MMPDIATMPEIGDKAPAFSGKTQDGKTIRLSDFRGQKLALYFYPKDNTSGCTKQACNLRDHYREMMDAGIAIVGVSTDGVKSHAGFAKEHKLPFPLIADDQKKVVAAYGVYGEKNMYGRTYMGTRRTTFLIDERGVIQHVIKRPKTQDHAREIQEKFED